MFHHLYPKHHQCTTDHHLTVQSFTSPSGNLSSLSISISYTKQVKTELFKFPNTAKPHCHAVFYRLRLTTSLSSKTLSVIIISLPRHLSIALNSVSSRFAHRTRHTFSFLMSCYSSCNDDLVLIVQHPSVDARSYSFSSVISWAITPFFTIPGINLKSVLNRHGCPVPIQSDSDERSW